MGRVGTARYSVNAANNRTFEYTELGGRTTFPITAMARTHWAHKQRAVGQEGR